MELEMIQFSGNESRHPENESKNESKKGMNPDIQRMNSRMNPRMNQKNESRHPEFGCGSRGGRWNGRHVGEGQDMLLPVVEPYGIARRSGCDITWNRRSADSRGLSGILCRGTRLRSTFTVFFHRLEAYATKFPTVPIRADGRWERPRPRQSAETGRALVN
jgi:hypothetical protein